MEECPSLKTEIMEEYHLVVAMLKNQWAKTCKEPQKSWIPNTNFKRTQGLYTDTNEARALLLVFVGKQEWYTHKLSQQFKRNQGAIRVDSPVCCTWSYVAKTRISNRFAAMWGWWNPDVYLEYWCITLSPLFSNSEDGTTHYFLFLPILDTFISLRFEHKLGKHTEGDDLDTKLHLTTYHCWCLSPSRSRSLDYDPNHLFWIWKMSGIEMDRFIEIAMKCLKGLNRFLLKISCPWPAQWVPTLTPLQVQLCELQHDHKTFWYWRE